MKSYLTQSFALLLLTLLVPSLARANPEPDLPVELHRLSGGDWVLSVEVDPRCFTEDPIHERYLMKVDLETRSAADLEAIKQQVAVAIPKWIGVEFTPPIASLKPKFDLAFAGVGGAALTKFDDPVVVTATCHLQDSKGITGWQVTALPDGRFSVVVKTRLSGTLAAPERTLFPGEKTPVLPLGVK